MLHGNIQVNHVEVLTYQIEYLGQDVEDTDVNVYGVVAWGRDNRGYPYHYEFHIRGRGTAPKLVAMAFEIIDEAIVNETDTGYHTLRYAYI